MPIRRVQKRDHPPEANLARGRGETNFPEAPRRGERYKDPDLIIRSCFKNRIPIPTEMSSAKKVGRIKLKCDRDDMKWEMTRKWIETLDIRS